MCSLIFSLVEDAGRVSIKPSFGGLLELCDGLLDAVAQHRGESRVREDGELDQGVPAPVVLVLVGIGGVGIKAYRPNFLLKSMERVFHWFLRK